MNPIYWPAWLVIAACVLLGLAVFQGMRVFIRDEDTTFYAAMIPPCVAAIALMVVFGIRADMDYEAWCQAQGGHTDSSTQTGVATTVSGNGQVGVGTTSTSTTYCLSSDGRIIDID